MASSGYGKTYLDSAPLFFPQNTGEKGKSLQRVIEKGGPATIIPEEFACPSGRHDKRLTECWCDDADKS